MISCWFEIGIIPNIDLIETVEISLQNAKNGTYKLIGDTFRKYPNETLVANTQVGVTRAVDGHYGFLEVKDKFLANKFELLPCVFTCVFSHECPFCRLWKTTAKNTQLVV
jgi:hypothetical protein